MNRLRVLYVLAICLLAASRVTAAPVEGEVLLAQLGCTSCHQANESTLRRLRPLLAPSLERVGERLSARALRTRVLGHGLMPDLLHGLPPVEREATAGAIASFLGATTGRFAGEPIGIDGTTIARGKLLVDTIGCRACHGTALEERDLASATNLQALAEFLLDPLASRPSGRMPGMRLSADEATEIAAYLLREQASDETGYAPGLWAEAFHLSQPGDNPDLADLEPVWRGVAETPTVAEVTRHDEVGLEFTGFVNVPAAGEWTFFTTSDDGSRLYLGERLVVRNDGHHPMVERSGKATLEAGHHPIRVTFFQAGGGLGLEVGWQGPGTPKQLIPAAAYGHEAALLVPPAGVEEPATEDVERGRRAYDDVGCAACHELPQTRWARPAPALVELAGKRGGCLAEAPPTGLPRYELDATQRSALLATLEGAAALAQPLPADRAVEHAMLRLDCHACHRRDGRGGPTGESREFFLATTDLGDEGRIPPDLSGVGARLTPEGLTAMLTGGFSLRTRTHMLTRMPEFGASNVADLVDLFVTADAREPTYTPPEFRAEDVALGRRLVGVTGFACITCHGFGGSPAIGTPGIDLLEVPGRVRHDWFHRHVWQPSVMRPETRMPTFWSESTRLFPELPGGGEPHYQIDAIWTYLSLGKSAPPPLGIAPSGDEYELVPVERPILFGTFMQGLSARTITVGYPERIHVAFDAHNVRLAKAWRGRFMNAKGTWHGRAGQLSQPAGDDVLDLPPGPAFAVLASRDEPWPAGSAREAGWRMLGRTLDPEGRPTFRYELQDQGMVVHETALPVLGPVGGGLQRRFKVELASDPGSNLYLRVAIGRQVEGDAIQGFRVVQGSRIQHIRTGPGAYARTVAGGGAEILVLVRESSVLEVEVSW